MGITPWDFKNLLDFILDNFDIKYENFQKPEYKTYNIRKIVGFIRFDKRQIYFDKRIKDDVEEITWAHEALSIYYYEILKVIKHDDEIEEEARALCENPELSTLIRDFIKKIKLIGTKHSELCP